MMKTRTEQLIELYPSAPFGFLLAKHFQPAQGSLTSLLPNELENTLSLFADYLRSDYVQTEPICHYVHFFKKYKKTYFVLQQQESLFVKGQAFPSTPPAVQVLFMAELKRGVLVAACDADKIRGELLLDIASPADSYIGAQGAQIQLKPDDIIVRDEEGIIISNIYGQDARTRITAFSTNILYVVMGVDGVSSDIVSAALADMERYLHAFDSNCIIEVPEIIQ